MKAPLTVHYLTKNNADTILQSLDSISAFNCEILVGDLGSKDNTTHLCASRQAKIYKLSLNDDISQARNNLMQKATTSWNIMLEPWEVVASGLEELKAIVGGKPCAYQVNVIEGDIVSKSVRIWHNKQGLQFQYPVYSVLGGDAVQTNIYLSTLPHKNSVDKDDLTTKWYAKCPLVPEANYYMSCMYLTQRKWDAFLNYADQYLHQEKKRPQSFYMTHYYRAMVYCYIKKDYQKALAAISNCLPLHPTMAEFWCMLADIYYAAGEHLKAYHFYENGLLLGQRRKTESGWPMEISKYKEYPEKMMAVCQKLYKSIKVYVGEDQNRTSSSLTTTVT
jgi:glycosyltransferase involved in cell wall biosynthesis